MSGFWSWPQMKWRSLHACTVLHLITWTRLLCCILIEKKTLCRLNPSGILWSFCGSPSVLTRTKCLFHSHSSLQMPLLWENRPKAPSLHLFDQIGARMPPSLHLPLTRGKPRSATNYSSHFHPSEVLQSQRERCLWWAWVTSSTSLLLLFTVLIFQTLQFAVNTFNGTIWDRAINLCRLLNHRHSNRQWSTVYRCKGMKCIRHIACKEKLTFAVIVQHRSRLERHADYLKTVVLNSRPVSTVQFIED